MSFKIIVSNPFKREAKKLIKKFPSLKSELNQLANLLAENPDSGTPLGNNCFKIRLAIASKGKGKSGGARIITHCYFDNETVFLLSIYDKSDKENISDKDLAKLLELIKS